jgi:serine/threonine protein kinase
MSGLSTLLGQHRRKPSLTVEIPVEQPKKRYSMYNPSKLIFSENGIFSTEGGLELTHLGLDNKQINVNDIIKEKKLGEGASGIVFKAKYKDKTYALKQVQLSDNQALLLMQEISNLYKTIGCKYITQFYDAFYADGRETPFTPRIRVVFIGIYECRNIGELV